MVEPEQVAGIVKSLTKAEARFLSDVADGRKLCCADRAEDKVRQKVRRLGLVHIVKNPRRWEATVTGLAVRSALIAALETKT